MRDQRVHPDSASGLLRKFWLPVVLVIATAFSAGFVLSLPADRIVASIFRSISAKGISLSAASSRITFSPGIEMTGVSVAVTGRRAIPAIDRVEIRLDWAGLFKGRPIRVDAERGDSTFSASMSPFKPFSERGTVEASRLAGTDIASLLEPEGTAPDLFVESLQASWDVLGNPRGRGKVILRTLTIPLSDPSSLVRSATVTDANIDFALLDRSISITGFTGRFEGCDVDGTGDIASAGPPRMTVHLRVKNPFEGKVATLFEMMSRNAKSATLRIKGSLASPQAEMLVF